MRNRHVDRSLGGSSRDASSASTGGGRRDSRSHERDERRDYVDARDPHHHDDAQVGRPRWDRDEDMGGSQWSGASGRGGMSYGDVEPRGFGGTNEGYGGHSLSHVREHERFRDGQRWGMSPDTDERRERGTGYGGEGTMRTDRDRAGVGRVDSARFEAARYGRSEANRYESERRDGGGRFESGRYDRREPYGVSESPNYPSFERPHQGEFQRWGNGTYGRSESRQGSPHPGYGSDGSDMGLGERGPHYGKGPKGYRRSDERIREDVCEIIARQGHIDASEVEISVEKAIVRLFGTVETRQDKRALEQMIESVHGIDEVHNEIRLTRGRGAVAAGGKSDSRNDKGETREKHDDKREGSVVPVRDVSRETSSRDTSRDDVRGDMTTSHVSIHNGRARS